MRKRNSMKLICVFILAACGGGGGGEPSTPPKPLPVPAYDWRDYAPLRQSTVREYTYGKWESYVDSPTKFRLNWGSIEEFSIKEIGGVPWLVLDAYSGLTAEENRYTIKVERAEYNDGIAWTDVSLPSGNPYVPITFTGQFTVRQWGWIQLDERTCNKFNVDPAKCAKWEKFFWQHRITPVGSVTNSCWVGDILNTRDTIRQEEVWWAASTGWHERGTGNLKNGEPDGTGIQYFWHQNIAKGAGFVWTGAGKEGSFCSIR